MSLVSKLMDMRNMIDLILESSGSSSGNTSLKLTKTGKPKKVSDRKGKSTANNDFTKKILAEHEKEYKSFQASSEKKAGAHFTFVSNYKKAHEEEFKAFVAAWVPKDTDTQSQHLQLHLEDI